MNSRPGLGLFPAPTPAYLPPATGVAVTDTVRLQTVLDRGGVILPAPRSTTATYAINAPLVVKGGTSVDFGRFTIQGANLLNNNLLVNTAYANGFAGSVRDTHIRVRGGTWVRGTDSIGTQPESHSILLAHIDDVTVQDVSITTTSGKFAICLPDCTDWTVERIYLNTFSDGVHIQGPGGRGAIRNIHGTTGDDMVSITPKDWDTALIAQTPSYGDITDLEIDGIFSNGSLCALKLTAGTVSAAAKLLRRVVARNIHGTTLASAVRIYEDAGAGQTGVADVGGITIEDLTAQPGAAFPQVEVAASVVRDIRTVRQSMDGTGLASAIMISYGAYYTGSGSSAMSGTVESITMIDPKMYGSPTVGEFVHIDGTAGVNRVTVAGPEVILSTNPIRVFNAVSANVTVKKLIVAYPRIECAGGNLIGTTATSKIDYIQVIGGHVKNAGTLVSSTSGAGSVNSVVQLQGVEFEGNVVVQANTGLLCIATGCVVTASLGFVRASANGARLVGSVNTNFTGGVSSMARTGTPTVSMNAIGMPVDVSTLAPTDGDQATNTNAGLGCGSGPVVYNTAATKWKHLYTGLTT